jgi:iron complex outermembrane receptor protein
VVPRVARGVSNRWRRRASAILIAALGLPGVASAQPPLDLTRLSLEDLLNVEITSVSRKPQSLTSAPAAIFVLTEDEIRASGLSSVPELLRLVPGVQVARYSNSKWSISARGMGTYYASKLLVMVDGRSIYTPDFSGVYWDLADIAVDEIERIEVIRGPGGTMWGANAVNGIVNIITRSAASTRGTAATFTTGNTDPGVASVRYGGSLGDQTDYRVHGNFSARQFDTGGTPDDSQRMGRAGFRLDHARGLDSFTAEADAYDATEHTLSTFPVVTAPYVRTIGDDVQADGGGLLGRWNHTKADGSGVTLGVYYDHTRRDEYIHQFRSDAVDIDFQQRLHVGTRHDVLWGTGYRHTSTTLTTSDVMVYSPSASRRYLFSGFLQDQIALGSALQLTVGSKIERHAVFGTAFAPNVRAMWTPTGNQSVWGAVSHAVRTPSLAEQIATFDYIVVPPSPATRDLPVMVQVVGNPVQEDLEEVIAYEAGYRARPLRGLSVDVALFRNDYDHLNSYSRGAASLSVTGGVSHLVVPSLHQNGAYGTSHGVETTATWTPAARLSLSGSLTLLDNDLHVRDTTADPGNSLLVLEMSPRRQVTIRPSFQVTRRIDADAIVQYTGPWQAGGVDGYSRTDLRVGFRPSPAVAIDFGVQNAFDERHMETALYLYTTPTAVPRSAYVRVSFKTR